MSTWVFRTILVPIEIGGWARVEPPSLKLDVSRSSTSSRASFASTSFQPSSWVLRVTSMAWDQTSVPPLVTCRARPPTEALVPSPPFEVKLSLLLGAWLRFRHPLGGLGRPRAGAATAGGCRARLQCVESRDPAAGGLREQRRRMRSDLADQVRQRGDALAAPVAHPRPVGPEHGLGEELPRVACPRLREHLLQRSAGAALPDLHPDLPLPALLHLFLGAAESAGVVSRWAWAVTGGASSRVRARMTSSGMRSTVRP
jgi:hypothetical protein